MNQSFEWGNQPELIEFHDRFGARVVVEYDFTSLYLRWNDSFSRWYHETYSEEFFLSKTKEDGRAEAAARADLEEARQNAPGMINLYIDGVNSHFRRHFTEAIEEAIAFLATESANKAIADAHEMLQEAAMIIPEKTLANVTKDSHEKRWASARARLGIEGKKDRRPRHTWGDVQRAIETGRKTQEAVAEFLKTSSQTIRRIFKATFPDEGETWESVVEEIEKRLP